MPTKKYALDEGGSERLEVSWKGGFKKLTLTVDGQQIGAVEKPKDLATARTFKSPDGRDISVLLHKGLQPELHLRVDGQHIPGSAGHPMARIKTASGVAFFIAGLNLVLGLIAVLVESPILDALGLGYFSLFFGAVFLGLALWIRKASTVALGIAIALFGLDGLLTVILTIAEGGNPPTAGIVARIFLLLPLIKAFGAAREARDMMAMAVKLESGARSSASVQPVPVPVVDRER